MWTIKPNYKEKQKCYYCGKNIAEDGIEVSRNLYRIIGKGFPLSVKYLTVDINIPRCKECKKRHDTAGKPTCLIFLMGIIVALCYVIYVVLAHSKTINIPSEASDWFGTICVLLSCLLIWLVISYFLGSIIRIAINAFMKGTKDEMDDENYSPIKKLMNIGFIKQKPDAAAHYGTATNFNEQILRDTLNSITKDDKCIIASRGLQG